MSWTKIDDGVLTHPKMLDAEERCPVFAWVLWTKALVYVNQYKLDGRVTRKVAARLVPTKHVRQAIDALVASGLWDEAGPDEFEFHNFRARNATAAERDAKAKANAAHQAAYRERQREAREVERKQGVSAYADESKSLTPGPVSEVPSRAAAGAHARDPVPSRPVPSRPVSVAAAPPAHAPAPEDPDAVAILVALEGQPSLARVATTATAEQLVAHVHSGTKRLSWVLEAIREYGEQEAIVAATDGPSLVPKLVGGLRAFVARARPPEQPRGSPADRHRPVQPPCDQPAGTLEELEVAYLADQERRRGTG